MRKWVWLVVAFALLGCATTRSIIGPHGERLTVYANDTLKFQTPLPADWRIADDSKTAKTTVELSAPDKSAFFILTVNPMATSINQELPEASELLKARTKDKRLPPNLRIQNVEGKVSGHASRGYRFSSEGITYTAFFIDHDRGIYLLITIGMNDEKQALLDYMYERLTIED